VIEIRNLLFQPLTFHLAGGGRGIHLNPRERRRVREEDVSPEIEAAARRGLVSLTALPAAPQKQGSDSESKSGAAQAGAPEAAVSPEPAEPAGAGASKDEPKTGGASASRRRKRR